MTDEAEKEIARLRTIIDCYAASSAAAAAELKRLRAEAHANWRDHIRPPDDFDRALAAATDEAWGISNETPTTAPAADGTDWPTSGAVVGTKAMTTDEKDVLTSVLLSEIGTAQKYNSLVFDLQAEIARLRLTDAEREAVNAALGWCDDRDTKTITILRSLLEKL